MRELPTGARSSLPAVLVVDDDPGDLLLTRHVLQTGGHFGTILTAESADEALTLFRDFESSGTESAVGTRPLLVLLDISMPVKDGHAFLEEFEEIRRSGDFESVVIAMLSSSSAEEDQRSAGRYEFVVDYLVKPLRIGDIESICAVLNGLTETNPS